MKLIPRLVGDVVRGYSFFCPACGELHSYNVSGSPPLWNFNGDLTAPSFSPSLRYTTGKQCHLYVTKGKIVYCSDCLHGYAGKTVELVELDEKGKPIMDNEPEEKAAEAKEKEKPKGKKSDAPARTHREECGEVGETGEHGDLGSNAAAKKEK